MALSIDNIYASLASGTASTTGLTSTDSLSSLAKSSNLQDQIENASSDDELMDACKSFESYFLQQVFQSMSSTVDSAEEEGEYTSMFKDTLYQSYADDAVESQGYGIAQMLYESMKRNQPTTTVESTSATTQQ